VTIDRIDARKLKDSASLHSVMAEAFGFAAIYGNNLDALIDCLTHLDDPKAGMSRVQVLPGNLLLLAIEEAGDLKKGQMEQLNSLNDVVAFVNWRRLENNQPPVLALAYER